MTLIRKKIAYGKHYHESVCKLANKEVKEKLNDTYEKLLSSPDAKGLNYESLECADPSFRSIRVNQDYRIILSEQPNAYILLHVDNHDNAYAWAQNRKLTLNPITGYLEVKDILRRAVSKQIRKKKQRLYLLIFYR